MSIVCWINELRNGSHVATVEPDKSWYTTTAKLPGAWIASVITDTEPECLYLKVS